MGKKKVYTDIELGPPPEDMFFGLTLNEGQQAFKNAIMSGQNQVATCELPVSYRGWLAQAIDGLS